MKKYLLIALASLFAFASCSKESDETPEVNTDNTVNLTFTSKRPQLKSESKTAWDGSTIVWSEGDKIRVGGTFNGTWMTSSGSATASFYQSNEVSIDTDNKSVGTFTVPNSFHDDKGAGTYIFYGYYPQSANSSSEQNNAPSVDLTVPTSQTPLSNSFDAGADVMLGKTESLSLAGLPKDPIEINWSRLVAHLDLTFKNLAFDGAETISSITLTANEDSKLTGTFTVDMTSGTMSAASSNVVVMEGAHLVANSGNVEAWCCVLPVTVTSLDVEVVTDKAKYTRSISGISKTFKQNARNTLAVNMSSATRTEQSEVYELYSGTISEGDYVIVYDGAAMKNTVSSNRLQYSDVTISDNKIANPASDIVWHLAPSGDYWTIYSVANSKYAAANGTKNQATLSESGTDDMSLWTVSGNDTYDFVNKNNSSKSINAHLRKNSTYGFACYSSSTGGALSLYKLADGRADAELSFAETSFNVNVGDDFTAPTLTNPHNVAVTYSSSNENLAVVDENTGEVVIGDNPGTVTIAASFAGDATYKPGTATYTITILSAGNDGTIEKPYTASEARALALGGDEGSYYIRGIVTKIQYQYDASHGTASFWIDENGTSQDVFEGYKIKYFGNQNWVEGNAEIAVGDQVIIYGTLTVYSGTTPETSSGHLVLLNGKTKGLTPGTLIATPDNNNKQITVTWGEATGSETTVSYVVSCGTQTYNASAAGSHTFTMADYGTYNVSVEASAEDAVSAKKSTTVILSDPAIAISPETITFSELHLSDGVQYSNPFDGGHFTIQFSGGANDGKYYNTGSGIRTYGDGSITISSSYKIKEIAFVWASDSNAPAADVANPTGYSTSTKKWTGSAKSVVLTRPSGSGHWRLQSVTVTYE